MVNGSTPGECNGVKKLSQLPRNLLSKAGVLDGRVGGRGNEVNLGRG